PARAAEILLGAFLALALAGRTVSPRLWVLAPAALVILGVCVVTFPAAGGPAYSGWLPAIGAVSALLLLGLQVDSPVRSACAVAPLVWLGRISYGVYLFHWPIFVVMNDERTGIDGPALFALRMMLTLGVAQLSFMLFEQPIRKAGGIGIRPTLVAAGGATAAVIVAAVIMVPGADSDYWATESEVVEAAALDTDDAPLIITESAVTAVEQPSEPEPPVDIDTEPSATSAATTTTTSTIPPIPELSRPVRMIVAGDSTGEAYGNGVVSWAAASPDTAQAELNVERGCGFVRDGEYLLEGEWFDVRDDCSDWLERDLPDRVAETGADVVLMVTTSWDVLDRRWDGGDGFATETDEMRARLRFDFTRVTDALLAEGAGAVVWVKAPIPNPLWLSRGTAQEQPARHAVLHEVMEEVVAANPGEVYVVDLLEYFDDAGYTDDVDLRPDGVHVSPEAAQIIATDFLGEQMIRAALDLL
ncbi:MAG: acyltransferase family protein, partial [Ilumatobacter sp.]|nr:acyltransferase family protein [Ilumatobacter sp.]